MLLKTFVESVCSDLQMEDPAFREKIIRELVPRAEETILSITGSGRKYKYSAFQRKVVNNETGFLLPKNMIIPRSISVGDMVLYPVENMSRIDSSSYRVQEHAHDMKFNYPLFVSNILNVNIPYTRTNINSGLTYTIQALDYDRFITDGRPNGHSMDSYFYDVGTIKDNENIFMMIEQMRNYSIIRVLKTPNTFVMQDDYLEIQTDYGDIKINISTHDSVLYIAEDGSVYTGISDTFDLAGLLSRAKEKSNVNMLFVKGERKESEKMSLEYDGKPFAYYHEEDDCPMLDSFYEHIKTFVLKEGARYFKMNTEYIVHNEQYNKNLSILIRENNIKKNMGKTMRFVPSETLGRKPSGR